MITDKVEQLYTELKKIPDFTKLLGNDGEDIYPIYPQEAMFLTKFSNRNHVVDMSCGVIENDKIIITDGPLMNLEGYITKIDRHKRIAYVDVELLGKITRVQVGLEIISKNIVFMFYLGRGMNMETLNQEQVLEEVLVDEWYDTEKEKPIFFLLKDA